MESSHSRYIVAAAIHSDGQSELFVGGITGRGSSWVTNSSRLDIYREPVSEPSGLWLGKIALIRSNGCPHARGEKFVPQDRHRSRSIDAISSSVGGS